MFGSGEVFVIVIVIEFGFGKLVRFEMRVL